MIAKVVNEERQKEEEENKREWNKSVTSTASSPDFP